MCGRDAIQAAGEPPGVPGMRCSTDRDCPADIRCSSSGYCAGNSGACTTDADCKYNEFCDYSPKHKMLNVPAACMPRGGRY